MHGGGMGQGDIFGTGSYGLGWALPRLDEALSVRMTMPEARGKPRARLLGKPAINFTPARLKGAPSTAGMVLNLPL
jgi:hypothetical protein